MKRAVSSGWLPALVLFGSVLVATETARAEPRPTIEEETFFDHPSGRARIEVAMRWKAEREGKR